MNAIRNPQSKFHPFYWCFLFSFLSIHFVTVTFCINCLKCIAVCSQMHCYLLCLWSLTPEHYYLEKSTLFSPLLLFTHIDYITNSLTCDSVVQMFEIYFIQLWYTVCVNNSLYLTFCHFQHYHGFLSLFFSLPHFLSAFSIHLHSAVEYQNKILWPW